MQGDTMQTLEDTLFTILVVAVFSAMIATVLFGGCGCSLPSVPELFDRARPEPVPVELVNITEPNSAANVDKTTVAETEQPLPNNNTNNWNRMVTVPDGDGVALVEAKSSWFVWKPISESTKTAAVVFPHWVRPSMLKGLKLNGEGAAKVVHDKSMGIPKLPDDHLFPNGDRMNVYFKKPGAAYGGPMTLTVKVGSKSHELKLSDASKRFEAYVAKPGQ